MRKTLALFLLLALCLSLAPLPVRAAEPTEIPIGRQQSIARDYYITEKVQYQEILLVKLHK